MNGNDLGVANRVQATQHRLSARGASRNGLRDFSQTKLLCQRNESRRRVGGQYDYNFIYGVTRLEAPERVNDDRNATKLEELLWSVAADPSSLACGDNDRDVHAVTIRYP